jgi:hypothetical protein
MRLGKQRGRLLVSGALVVAVAVYFLASSTASTSYQSSLSIPPGEAYFISATRDAGDSVSGSFQEAGGANVSFFIFTTAQYEGFTGGTLFDSVYNITDVPSSSVSYVFPSHDTYYLAFVHGQGSYAENETVNFQRTYSSVDTLRLGLGVVFLAFGVIEVVLAARTGDSDGGGGAEGAREARRSP